MHRLVLATLISLGVFAAILDIGVVIDLALSVPVNEPK
jgi:hypothetical protein